MAKHTSMIRSMIGLVVLALLVGLSSCSRLPSKSASHPSQHPPAPTNDGTDAGHEVEKQLLRTMSEARKLGPANPLLLSTMYSLASFYRNHQEFGKAERIYQEALSLKEQTNGPDHHDVAMILNQYAALLRDARRVQEATALEHRARQILAVHTQPAHSRP